MEHITFGVGMSYNCAAASDRSDIRGKSSCVVAVKAYNKWSTLEVEELFPLGATLLVPPTLISRVLIHSDPQLPQNPQPTWSHETKIQVGVRVIRMLHSTTIFHSLIQNGPSTTELHPYNQLYKPTEHSSWLSSFNQFLNGACKSFLQSFRKL